MKLLGSKESAKKREAAVYYAKFLIAHADQIDYEEVRPMRTRGLTYEDCVELFKRGGRLAMDCSESTTLICKWAGFKSPNGFSYESGYGNTDSMMGRLKSYQNVAGAKPGALIIYHNGDVSYHVIMVLDHLGENPMCFSHGSQIGPLYISLDNESSAHVGEGRSCFNVAPLL